MRLVARGVVVSLTGIGLVVALVLSAAAPAVSGEPAVPEGPPQRAVFSGPATHDARYDKCRDAVVAVVEQDSLPGLSVAVVREGELVWSEGFGQADRERDVPVTVGTLFRIGSVSKALTSAALGLLVQDGTLDLDAPVQKYVPSFPEKSGTITTRLAAAHLSGLPQYRGAEFVNRRHYDSVVDALVKFQDLPLESAPGQRFHYSSYGWNLVGAVLERASATPFLELMQDRVFGPLGLEHTGPELPGEVDPQQAKPYASVSGATMRPPKIDNSDAWPSAGFLSTAEDLVRFGESMLSNRLLKAETVDLLWAIEETSSGEPTGYGLGWEWVTLAGRRAVGHGGSHIGATAALWIVPGDHLVVALLTNTNSRQLSGLVETLVGCLLGPVERDDRQRD